MPQATHLTEADFQALLKVYQLGEDALVQKMLALVGSERGHLRQTRIGGGKVLEEAYLPRCCHGSHPLRGCESRAASASRSRCAWP